ncbi:BTAD domain-containing putative transcriptional regulator [Saccharothrix syringae]|uniref:Transcriptional regulator n=1 Tax=Saccharothrix syringae TaxID=103733 RepID=A0A5Q0GX19_SACSY|nr:BTAD domain-containing putative transcriptional regulator [Saccharothrix syringae]QFZ18597.1 transcriptional regulator [Saccharothrix syringae]
MPPAEPPRAEPLFAELLGPVRVFLAGTEIDLGAARRQAVFTVLALRANQPVALDELVDAVWGDQPPTNAEASVYTYVSGLRKLLEPHRSARSAPEVLVSTGSGYSLRLGPGATDVALFEAHRQRAASMPAAAAVEELEQALALWRGEALAGVPGPFARTRRTALAELRLATAERRAALALELGRHAEVVPELTALAAEHPLREGLRALLMTALHGAGRHAEALAVFRETRRLLVDQLGIEPGAELLAVYQRLLQGMVAPAAPLRATIPVRKPPTPPNVVGRQSELELLRRSAADLAAGRGGGVWLDGEPGIGKSALLAALLAEVGAQGVRIAWGTGDELGMRFPLRVLLDALGVSTTSDDPVRAAVAEALLEAGGDDSELEAVDRLVDLVAELCGRGPLVLAVDDLHWADGVSALAWHRLVRLTRRLPLLLVGTCRPVPRRDDLDRVREAVRGTGGQVLRLGPLPDEALVELVTRRLAATPTEGLRRLIAQAGGNPAYAVSALDELVGRDAIRVRSGVAELTGESDESTWSAEVLPPDRLDFLSVDAVEVLRTGALFGMEFAIGDVAVVLDRSPSELVSPVQEALTAGVLVEADAEFAFRHPLLRHGLYESVLPPVRAALHRHAARALAGAGAPAVRVARHLAAAAPNLDAWSTGWVADNVREVMLTDQDLVFELIRSAADQPTLTDAQRDRLTSWLAWLRFWRGERPESEARAVLAHTRDPHLAAEMRCVLAMLYLGEGQVEAAAGTLRVAVENDATPEPCRTRQEALLADIYRSGFADLEKAEWYAHDAISRAEQSADGFAMSHSLRVLWQISTARRDHVEALAQVDLALTMIGDPQDVHELRPVLLENRAFTLQNLDRLEEAGQALRAAQARARRGPSAAFLRAWVAVHEFWTGRWDDALAGLEHTADVVDQHGLKDNGPALLVPGLAALVEARRGRLDEARAHLATAADHPMALVADREHADFLLAARAFVAECEGAGVTEVFGHLEPLLREQPGHLTLRHQWMPNAVRSAVAVGAWELAERAHRVCVAEAARERVPARAFAAEARCRGLLQGDPEPLRTAVARYRMAGRPVELAEALEDLAVVLTGLGAAGEADAAFREALAGYEALGAARDVLRAEKRLLGTLKL